MPHILTPRSTTRDLWVRSDFPGEPEYGPFLLPDGTDVHDLVVAGHLARLDFVPRFRKDNSGNRIGDLIWAGGIGFKLASRRMIDVLTSVGATGWRDYPVELWSGRGKGAPMNADIVGLAATGESHADVTHADGHATFRIQVSSRVFEALTEAGVNEFEVESS